MSLGNLDKKNKFDGNLVFGAKSFNKITKRDKHLKVSKKKNDFSNYLNNKKQLLKKYSKNRNCPSCNSSIKNSRVMFIKEGFTHRRCYKCDMFYVSPILNDKINYKFHYGEKSFYKVYENPIQIKMDKRKFSYGLEIINRFHKKKLKKKLLDIGCGLGGFIKLAKEKKWVAEGIEFNKYSSNILTQKGFQIYNNYLNKLNLKKDYSCISMWNLFEHLTDPKQTLEDIKKILLPGGLVFILVPNINGLVNTILKEKAVAFAGYTHLNFFNIDTLKKFLIRNDFKVLHYETVFTEIETIKNYLSFEDPYFGNATKGLNYFSPKYIHKNYLGSKLIMLAQLKIKK